MHELIANAKKENRNLLEHEAMALFAQYGIPGPDYALTTSPAEAMQAAEKIGYPVVLKVVSPDIIHKSDVGGVEVGMKTKEEVAAAYDRIMQNAAAKAPGAKIHGILVLSFAKPGVECIVGMTKDSSFGPAIMFGLGGIFVELLKDVAFRVLPLDRAEVFAMMQETKGYQMLTGLRGQKAKDVDALADLILNVARMIAENPEIEELDINPLFVYDEGVRTVDARILL
jgi:acyl-CoA synthetase (NDP forming)